MTETHNEKILNFGELTAFCLAVQSCIGREKQKIDKLIATYQHKLARDQNIKIDKNTTDQDLESKELHLTKRMYKQSLISDDFHKLECYNKEQVHNCNVLDACDILMVLNNIQRIQQDEGHKIQNKLIVYTQSMLDGSLLDYTSKFKRKMPPHASSKTEPIYNALRKDLSDFSKQDYLKHQNK